MPYSNTTVPGRAAFTTSVLRRKEYKHDTLTRGSRKQDKAGQFVVCLTRSRRAAEATGFEVALFAFQTADSQEFRARAQSKTVLVLVLEFGVSMTITSTIALSTSTIP